MGNDNTQAWRPSDRLCPKLVGRLMTKGAAQWGPKGKKELDQSGSVSFCNKARNFASLVCRAFTCLRNSLMIADARDRADISVQP